MKTTAYLLTLLLLWGCGSDTSSETNQCVVDEDCGTAEPCSLPLCVGGICSVEPLTGLACNDGDLCTMDTYCADGVCGGGVVLSCDDQNPCTDDSCSPDSGCTNASNTLPCDDTNDCTLDDQCVDSNCVGGTINDCDDGNICTQDSCSSEEGCTHTNVDVFCSDGDLCSQDDVCVDGVCEAGTPLDCDDQNPCTDDSCSPTQGCVHTVNDDPCDDRNECTAVDQCGGGSCVGMESVDCNDGNLCTTDSCDPELGCIQTDNNELCSDGDACSLHDVCLAGSCVPGDPLPCDDGNPCTDDFCDSTTGCVHLGNTDVCDDGNACTVVDICIEGSCQGITPLDCYDGNTCTKDLCFPLSGCSYEVLSGSCDDGNVCTVGETCSVDGTCTGGSCLEDATCAPQFPDQVCMPGECCRNIGATIHCFWSDAEPVFDGEVVTMSAIDSIVPLGSVTGDRISDTTYIYMTGLAQEPVYAPADGVLYQMAYYHMPWEETPMYLLFFQTSCEVGYHLDNLISVADSIGEAIEETPVIGSSLVIDPAVYISVEAGDFIGTVDATGPEAPLYFGVINLAKPVDFINPARYGESKRTLYADCPYDYFTAPLQNAYYQLFGTSGHVPVPGSTCRSASRDVAGTLAGAWFLDTALPLGPFGPQIAISTSLDGQLEIGGLGDGLIWISPDAPTFVLPEAVTTEHCYQAAGHFSFFKILPNQRLAVMHGSGPCPTEFLLEESYIYDR
ncbi:MAG: hypothetical protein CMH54_10840 [Myxococcales bacterium]|nr:hypothetical protein [Myxococcales bacterium]